MGEDEERRTMACNVETLQAPIERTGKKRRIGEKGDNGDEENNNRKAKREEQINGEKQRDERRKPDDKTENGKRR